MKQDTKISGKFRAGLAIEPNVVVLVEHAAGVNAASGFSPPGHHGVDSTSTWAKPLATSFFNSSGMVKPGGECGGASGGLLLLLIPLLQLLGHIASVGAHVVVVFEQGVVCRVAAAGGAGHCSCSPTQLRICSGPTTR